MCCWGCTWTQWFEGINCANRDSWGGPGNMVNLVSVSLWKPHFCKSHLLRYCSCQKQKLTRPQEKGVHVLILLTPCPWSEVLPSRCMWDPSSQLSLQSDGRPGCQFCLPETCLIILNWAGTVCPSFGTLRLRSEHLFFFFFFNFCAFPPAHFWEMKIMLSFKRQ